MRIEKIRVNKNLVMVSWHRLLVWEKNSSELINDRANLRCFKKVPTLISCNKVFWKEDKTVLPLNRDLVIMPLKPLENKFKRNLVFHEIYKELMKKFMEHYEGL